MKITTPSTGDHAGEYLRDAQTGDVQLLLDVTKDWPGPNGAWSRQMCQREVEASVDRFDPNVLFDEQIPNIPNLVLVHCLPDATAIGFLSMSYYGGAAAGADVHSVGLLRTYRGLGHFTGLQKAVGWFIAEHLQAQSGAYEILAGAEPVLRRSVQKGPTAVVLYIFDAKVAIRLDRDAYVANSDPSLGGYALVSDD